MLLSPVRVANLTLKNRVVMSPMCLFDVQKEDGVLTPIHFAHYIARAIGQVGLIIIEATAVEPEGRITNKDLGLWNDRQQRQLTKLVTILHKLGTKVGIQLNHAGRKAEDVQRPWGPSPIPYSAESNQPVALTTPQIRDIVKQFGQAAYRADKAGIDVIDIHAAHGYLIDQFLSPYTNQRKDNYGGNLNNRYRILKEIISAVKANFSGSIWTRLSLTDYVQANHQNSLNDWLTLGQWLQNDGINLLDISTGGLFPVKPNIPVYSGYQTQFSTKMKQVVNIPVSAVGLLGNPGLAEYILQNHQADLILEGRALLRDPNWIANADIKLHDHQLQKHTYNYSYYRGFKSFPNY